ncbi:hypothetical protein SEA_LEONA_33 [Arthrobacter phage Leona]|nr:hypothetical protein SEA_LEONA_33 [Arthrobacter phage Leona]
MNAKQLTTSIARTFDIRRWDAGSRVDFAIEELEIDPNNISEAQAAEIERCIAADLRAGK